MTSPEAAERLAIVEATLERIERRLFGNGQPGVIEEFDKRILRLEQWKWWLTGAAFAIGSIIGYVLKVSLKVTGQ